MVGDNKQKMQKSPCDLLRWLALSLLFVGTHALAQTGGTVTYVYTDPQGTPLAEADTNGNVTATFEYTPYGTFAPQGTSSPGPVPKGPGYTGHVNDPETNLTYMQARYYDSTTGRFLSADPVAVSAGVILNFNRYDYGDDNPVVHTDPTGKFPGDINDSGCAAAYNCQVSFFSSASNEERSVRANGNGRPDVALGSPPNDGRTLTDNEKEAEKKEFKNINVDVIHILFDRKDAAYTPGNTMHFPSDMAFCSDFVTCHSGDYLAMFMHESTHVWQHQNGRSPFWGHVFSSDIVKFSGYLSLQEYKSMPVPIHLNTEREADWHMWHYMCTSGLLPCN
jgi:RHS repeat-associated protein